MQDSLQEKVLFESLEFDFLECDLEIPEGFNYEVLFNPQPNEQPNDTPSSSSTETSPETNGLIKETSTPPTVKKGKGSKPRKKKAYDGMMMKWRFKK